MSASLQITRPGIFSLLGKNARGNISNLSRRRLHSNISRASNAKILQKSCIPGKLQHDMLRTICTSQPRFADEKDAAIEADALKAAVEKSTGSVDTGKEAVSRRIAQEATEKAVEEKQAAEQAASIVKAAGEAAAKKSEEAAAAKKAVEEAAAAEKAAEEAAAAEKAAEEGAAAKKAAEKAAAAKKAAEEAAAAKKAAEEAAAAKKAAEEAAAAKKASEEAAAAKKAAEAAAAKKAAEEAAAKKAAEEAAAKKAAEEAAAKKLADEAAAAKAAAEAAAKAAEAAAAEELAIMNSVDPIQQLFIDSIHSYSIDPATLKDSPAVTSELERVAKQFGIGGIDATAFPKIEFVEPTLDAININK